MNTEAQRAAPDAATMSAQDGMQLQVLLPFRVFLRQNGVRSIVAETSRGAFGILPHRLDCVASLTAGIFAFETAEDEVYLAVDEGVLVKTGARVSVSVRNAIGGADLGRLREAVEREFSHHDERERQLRSTLAKLESGFIRRFAELRRE